MQRLMIRRPKIYERMGEASFTPGAGLTLLITFGLYIAYFLVREILSEIIDLIYYSGYTVRDQAEAEKVIHDYITAPGTMLISLALMSVLLALTVVYTRGAEKRPSSTLGLVRPVLNRFSLGYIGGLALFLLAVLPGFLTGTAQYKGATPVAALFILGYIIQAAAEEVFFRGYMLSSLVVKTGAISAVLISSALFTGLYIWNNGALGLMIPVVFLMGVLYAFLTLRTGSVWPAVGIHAAYSFTYGLVSPVVMASLETDYSVIDLSGGGAGGIYPIAYMAAITAAICFVLFAGENRLAVPLSDELRMYLEARRTARNALKNVRGNDGVPLKKLGFSVAAEVQGCGTKAAALLYIVSLGSAGFEKTDYSTDVVGAVDALLSRKGFSKNSMAAEIRVAYEKHRGALKEKYKEYANRAHVYCPLLRRETDEAGCAETVAAVDGGGGEGLFAMMNLKVCLKCQRRNKTD